MKSHAEQLKLQERLTNATEALQARLQVVYGGPNGLKPKVDAASGAETAQQWAARRARGPTTEGDGAEGE